MNVYGYARVSTKSQTYEAQIEQIQAYCEFKQYTLIKIFADKSTGKDTLRPAFQELIREIEHTSPHPVVSVVVTRLDRIGRSIRDLLRFVDWCTQNSVNLVALSNNIDTNSKEGRLFLYLLGALAEYERELIQERMLTGRSRYCASGGKLGRSPKPVDIDLARRLIAEGVPKTTVARRLKIAKTTLYKHLTTSGYLQTDQPYSKLT